MPTKKISSESIEQDPLCFTEPVDILAEINLETDGLAGDVLSVMKFDELTDTQKVFIVRLAVDIINLPTELADTVDSREVQGILAREVGEEEAWNNFYYTKSHGEAGKLFLATLFAGMHKLQRQGSDDTADYDAIELARKTREIFFGMSPNISSYVGGTSDSVELLSFLQRGSVARKYFSGDLIGEVVYNNTFSGSGNALYEPFEGKDAVDTIRLIATESMLSSYAIGQGEWSEPFAHKAIEVFIGIANDSITPPFVRLVALNEIDKINSELNEDSWVYLDELPEDEQRLVLDANDMRKKQDKQMQEGLHQAFPGFAADSRLVRIAPDICASVVGGYLDTIIDTNGRRSLVADWRPNNAYGMSENEMTLLRVAHGPAVKEKIEAETGLVVSSLSLDVQLRLLRFMIDSDSVRYDRLISALNNISEKDKPRLTEAFLATEFGEDFGEKILTIAEKTSPEDALRVFESVTRYRECSKKYAEWFGVIDDDFRLALERAANERMTEVLALVAKVANDGPQVVDISPNSGRIRHGVKNDDKFKVRYATVDQVVEDIKPHIDGMELGIKIMSDPDVVITKAIVDNQGFQIYRYHSQKYGDALLHTRRYGSSRLDRSVEYGNYSGTEATVSLTLNPSNPFDVQIKSPDALRVFGADREGRAIGEAPDSDERTPIRNDGLVSYDNGSISGNKRSDSFRAGAVFAAGNVIRSEELGEASSLHHNTNYFNQLRWGSTDGFALWVGSIDASVEAQIANQPKNLVSKQRLMARAALREAA